MTAQEYQNLKRFPKPDNIDFEKFCNSLHLPENAIFEIYTLTDNLVYAKITASFENLFFDITQTTEDGKIVRCPLYVNSITKSAIAERIYQGDWRIKE